MSNTTRTARVTLASTNARIDALVTANTKTVDLIARLVAQMEAHGQFATPEPVVAITSAPSYDAEQANREPSHAGKRTRKGGRKVTKAAAQTFVATGVMSYANAQTLVDAGADPSTVMVFGGQFGKGEPQTFADAKARRDASEAKRAEYVANRASERTAKPAKASKASKASKKLAAAPVQANAAMISLTGAQLKALGTDEANAEIARRAAKRAARKGA